jgi:hypothetical protein
MLYYFLSHICTQFIMDYIKINNLVHLSYHVFQNFSGNGLFL